MQNHSGSNSLNVIMFKRSLFSYVKRLVINEMGLSHTGIIQEVVNVGGSLSNIIIEITDVEGSPHLSWSDSHFIIKEGDVFAVNDPVMLLPVRGRYFILKIEDDFRLKVERGVDSITGSSATVTHGLGVEPNKQDITIIFTEDNANDIGHWYISSASSTQFIVNVHTAVSGTLDFAWKVDLR